MHAADTFDVVELRKVVAQIIPLGLEKQNICNVCRETLKHLTKPDVYVAGSVAYLEYDAFLRKQLQLEAAKKTVGSTF